MRLRKHSLRVLAVILLIASSSIYTKAQNMIDVHAHIISNSYCNVLKTHNALLEEGFPLPTWNVKEQLSFMDNAGIRTAVLTMCAPQPYFGNAQEAAQIIRKVNQECANLKTTYPGRFLFCASLPLPDVTTALSELAYAIDTLHADGIKLATNSRGQYLGDPALEPLMAELNRRATVVILHPHKPDPYSEQLMQATPLAMQEYLSETTRAVANMITHNVMARYPRIKFVVPHCGAFLPTAIPRMKSLTKVMQDNGMIGEIQWEKNLANLYYDLAGSHSPEAIRALLTITTPDHLLYGSDYPYAASHVLQQSAQRMKNYLTNDLELSQYRDMLLFGNAERLFGLSEGLPPSEITLDSMLIRLSEVEVYPEYLQEYLRYATKVGEESVMKEPGVVCIYLMQEKEDSCKIRIVEIYRTQEAYKAHIASSHFQRYKQGTLKMVKHLKLIDMNSLDPAAMFRIFKK